MEFKVNSKVLEKLLSKIIPAVPSRTPMPILENFLFEIKKCMTGKIPKASEDCDYCNYREAVQKLKKMW